MLILKTEFEQLSKAMFHVSVLKQLRAVLFLSFRRVLNVICSFLGNSPASEF